MIKLIKIELSKFFSARKILYLYGGLARLVFMLLLFLRVVASESSFGHVFKTASDTFSIFAVVIGAILTLVSFHQEVQQKTMKNLLVTPVKRSEILFAKFFLAIFASLLTLLVLLATAFLATTFLFGFFTNGAYSSSTDNMLAFTVGLLQILTAFFSTIFYSSFILILFLISNSLSGTLVGIIFLRGIGELISRSLLNQTNLWLSYSPLGLLNILNPITSKQTMTAYAIQLALTLLYALALFSLSCKLFEKREF